MRIDKFLTKLNIGTRSEVKQILKRGQITVNGEVVKTADFQVDENHDRVFYLGRELVFREYVYYLLNKPAGCVSATEDAREETVLDLLRPRLEDRDQKRGIAPVGRLDKDTTGFLLLTDDGGLAHELLSPKKHVDKTYLVSCREPLTEEALAALEQGVDIGEKNPATATEILKTAPDQMEMTIHEGKYHQVKRMLHAVGNEVTALKRIKFGGMALPDGLAEGEFAELSREEAYSLRNH